MPSRFYLSPLPPEECRRRLKAATNPDTFWNRCFPPQEPGVLANHLSETDFRLFYMGVLGHPQVLHGTFAPTPDGSVIAIEVRSYPQSWIFPVIWFTGLFLLGGKDWVLGVLQLLTGKRSLADTWEAVLLFPFLLLVSALFFLDTEPSRKQLLNIVKGILEAREIEPRATTA